MARKTTVGLLRQYEKHLDAERDALRLMYVTDELREALGAEPPKRRPPEWATLNRTLRKAVAWAKARARAAEAAAGAVQEEAARRDAEDRR